MEYFYVILFSVEQGCFHIERNDKTIESNLRCLNRHGKFNGYHVVSFAKTHKAASASVDELRKLFHEMDIKLAITPEQMELV